MTQLHSAVNQEGAAIGAAKATSDATQLVLAGVSLPQPPTTVISTADRAALIDQLQHLRDDTAARYRRVVARTKGGRIERVMAVIRDASIRRSRTGFDDPVVMEKLRGQIAAALNDARALRFALPLGGGKAPNSLKTGDYYLPDLGEWVAAALMAAMAEVASEAAEVTGSLVIIPDAGLHTADIGMSAAEYRAHLAVLRDDLAWMGIADRIAAVDTLDHLPVSWADDVRRLASEAITRAATDTAAAEKISDQVASLRYSLNTRVLGWTDARAVLANRALVGDALDMPREAQRDAAEIEARTRAVVGHYIGVNHALRIHDVPARIMRDLYGHPEYVRLTVHAKAGEPRPGLVPSSSLSRPGLLPMHSVGVWGEKDGEPRLATFFDIEARMAGASRVVDSTGRFLFYRLSAAGTSG